MGKIFDRIDDNLAAWIGKQRLFFVATAPGEGGHVNVSPKGPIGSLRILDGQTTSAAGPRRSRTFATTAGSA
jgi:hypothetical protein